MADQILPRKPSPTPRNALTFGVEFEFCFADYQPRRGEPEPDPTTIDPRTKFQIPRHWYNIGPRLITESYALRQQLIEIFRAAGIEAEQEDLSTRDWERSWIIKNDYSIEIPMTDKVYEWKTMEITSPPFFFKQQAFGEIKAVLELLERTYKMHTNRSTGLHVHVGDNMRGLQLQTVRNLLGIIWTFDPTFESIHPKHRRGWTGDYVRGFRASSVLAMQLARQRRVQEGKGYNPDCPRPTVHQDGLRLGLIELLDTSKTFEDLRFLAAVATIRQNGTITHSGEYVKMSYELGRAIDGEGDANDKRTIEFRHHEGTLDFNEVSHWVRFCVQIVETAETIEQEALEKFLFEHISDLPDVFPLEKVLEKLGMLYLAHYYANRPAREEESEPDPDDFRGVSIWDM